MSLNALDNLRRWVGVAIKANLKGATGGYSGHGTTIYQVNGPAGSRAPLATDKVPEDRTSNTEDCPTRIDQGYHPKETNIPKCILRTGFGHRNT